MANWWDDYKYYDGEDDLDYVEEVRVHRKKSSGKWCKGKEGKKHEPVPELNLSKIPNRQQCYYGSRYEIGRGWQRAWLCIHSMRCKNCSKILELDIPECPDKED